MTDKENEVRQCELDVRAATASLREARRALEIGSRKAKAEYEEAINELAHEVTKAQIDCERKESQLAKARADITEPYKNNDS